MRRRRHARSCCRRRSPTPPRASAGADVGRPVRGIWERSVCGVTDPKLLPPLTSSRQLPRAGQVLQYGTTLADRRRPQHRPIRRHGASDHRRWRRRRGCSRDCLIASVLSISIGVAVRYFPCRETALPTITLLVAGVADRLASVAIFRVRIGNAPAIFMVVVALSSTCAATVSQIDGVNRNLINVARTMGATKWQIYTGSSCGDPAGPADGSPSQYVRCLDGGAGRESTGVGYGLGQVIMLARNTSIPHWCSHHRGSSACSVSAPTG